MLPQDIFTWNALTLHMTLKMQNFSICCLESSGRLGNPSLLPSWYYKWTLNVIHTTCLDHVGFFKHEQLWMKQ
jgi:hypothetical protein